MCSGLFFYWTQCSCQFRLVGVTVGRRTYDPKVLGSTPGQVAIVIISIQSEMHFRAHLKVSNALEQC